MRALSVTEIDNLVRDLSPLVGVRLQEVVLGKGGCALGFWTEGQISWLWFEAHTWQPVLLPLNQAPEKSVKPLQPLALFLRAHFVGRRLLNLSRISQLGRAVVLDFGQDDEGPIAVEIHLWPHGANFIASAQGKRVAWRRDLAKNESAKTMSAEPEPRPLAEILRQWQAARQTLERSARSSSEAPEPALAARRQNQLAKLEKAREKVRAEIAAKSQSGWREAGDWLVAHQNLRIPDDLSPFVDRRRSLAWNIENAFSRAKENERKLENTRQRLTAVEEQLKRLLEAPLDRDLDAAKPKARGPLPKTAKFKTVALPGGLVARLGRSGADNLSLLRSARPWDLWLHLRDFAGSHAIVMRERERHVADDILRLVGAALVEQSFGNKAKQHSGEKFEIIVAECRFVRPIRGDKRGQVNYSHERTIGFRWI